MRRAVTLIAAALIAPGGIQPAPDIDGGVRDVLMHALQFSASELNDMQRGRAVKHGLDAHAPGEFGVAGGIRIAATKAAFLDAARDIVTFKAGEPIVQIGRFSSPPTIDDLAPLKVDKTDFDANSCRVGDCGVRLPAEVIQRVPKEIDVKGGAGQDESAAWFRRVLLADVQAYVSGGPGRFVQYDDGNRQIRPIDAFEGILAATPAVGTLVPGLPAHLSQFPSSRVPDSEDFLYWSKETFGPEPFISVTHVTIVCPTTNTCAMTTKDVYSSRYIDASLALAIVTDAAAGDAIYVVYANRSRVNALRGALSTVRKSVVERRARSTLEQSLVRIKVRLEKK
ncbi:MAG TPA: hypothetical protein VKE96_34375 [Vicinamibacterales bacterium]|nr:hypothetical protein [Vicinamibacterales bacterium]